MCAAGPEMTLWLRLFLFCFKQKTAYEMRISDWSSDVCSSDLGKDSSVKRINDIKLIPAKSFMIISVHILPCGGLEEVRSEIGQASCRGRVVSVRVDLGSRRIINKKTHPSNRIHTSYTTSHRKQKATRME